MAGPRVRVCGGGCGRPQCEGVRGAVAGPRVRVCVGGLWQAPVWGCEGGLWQAPG